MKPYISVVLEHNGKTYRLPLPPKYRELTDCARILHLKNYADEDDLNTIGFETLMGLPKPGILFYSEATEKIASKISSLTPKQVSHISDICGSFGIEYTHIGDIISCIKAKSGGDSEWE